MAPKPNRRPAKPTAKPVTLPSRTSTNFKQLQAIQAKRVRADDKKTRIADQSKLKAAAIAKNGKARELVQPAEPEKRIKANSTTPLDKVVKSVVKARAPKKSVKGRPTNEVTVTEGTPGRPANKKGK